MAAGRTFRDVRGSVVGEPGTGGPNMRMIEGLDGILSSTTAVAQEVGNLSREMRILNERNYQMYGRRSAPTETATDRRDMVTALQEVIEQQTSSMLAAIKVQPPQDPGALKPTSEWLPTPGTPRDANGWAVSPAHTGRGGPTTDQMRGSIPEVPAGEDRSGWQDYSQRRDYFGGVGKGSKFTIANIRKDFGTRVSQGMENAHWGPEVREDPLGVERFYDPAVDEFGERATESEVAAAARRGRITAAVRGGAQTLAEGGTFRQAGAGMIPGALAKTAGWVGAGLSVGKAVGDFATDQRAKNNEWIAMQGGSQMDAVEERARGQMFKLSQFGTLTGADADSLYRGVAATGLQGDQRTNAQDFAIANYKELGMGIAESLEIIQFAAENGQESLTGLATSLRSVSESAQAAGINSEVARASFVQNWQDFSSVLSGSESTSLAAGFTSAQMGLGHEFQNLDFSGTMSPEMIRMMASQTGQSVNDLIAEAAGPDGDESLAGRWSGFSAGVVSDQLGSKAMSKIAEVVQNREDPNGPLTEAEMEGLTQELLSDPTYGIPDADILAEVLGQMTGVQGLNARTALPYAIRQISGEMDPAAQIVENNAKGETFSVHDDPKAAGNKVYFDPGTRDWYVHDPEAGDEEKAYLETPEVWEGVEDDLPENDVANAFVADVNKSGRMGGISQMIAEQSESLGFDEVQVETKDGTRVVSLDEAMEFYRDQIDSGTAIAAGGEFTGQTVADVLQTEGDSSVEVTSTEDDEDRGVSAEEWNKEHADVGGGSGGKVIIQPTAELRRYFEFVPTGNAELDPNALREPPNPDVTPEGRATGSVSR